MIVETERLILRPFTERDAADAYEYLHEPMVHCFACMKTETAEDARRAVLDRAKDGEFYFAITLKDGGKVIGEIEAMPETHAPDEENAALDTFSPCWMLNPAYHGKGYAYEAAYAFFDYLFERKGARRIYAYTEDYNVASQKLCEKLGMRREGFYREFISFVNDENGRPIYENTYEYAILKREWEQTRTKGGSEGDTVWNELYNAATNVQNGRTVSPFIDAGGVAAAILTKQGHMYVGVCIDTASTLGMCAERNAIANMITHGESQIDKVVAVMPDGRVGSPCGACREYMMQLDKNSGDIEILLDLETRKTVRLKELIPDWWGYERFEESSLSAPPQG